MGAIDDRLRELGITLPKPLRPVANYLPGYRVGNLVFLSGVGPRTSAGELISGKLGADCTVERGYEAARWCGLHLLTNLQGIVGDLDKVVHFVKLLGMVNATPDFKDTPAVINGCSDLLVEIFGERGKHGRSAVGMGTLPFGMAVEIEGIVEVRD
ncbi:MAG: RidA family protein [SAR202 cluster bacterium]|nr:RidA family protein [SAR202 cluster bacterium]